MKIARQSALWLAFLMATLLVSMNMVTMYVNSEQEKYFEVFNRQDPETLAESLQYLENLDAYLTQMARPRFGRSSYKQPRIQFPSERTYDQKADLGGFKYYKSPEWNALDSVLYRKYNENH